MLEYEKRYKTLNTAQKQAVDHIDGPLMVVAGPGTGKTELLSLRVATILKRTDMSPGNILCLTFTESGVRAMRERLIGLIGQEAYKVNVQTFHGFGSEIINNNPDYFYSGADFRPADELSSYEILYKLFQNLSYDNPLSKKLGDEFTSMRRVQNSISDFKRAGLTPDEIQRICKNSMQFIESAEPIFQKHWPSKIDKSIINKLPELIKKIEKFEIEPTDVPNVPPLAEICINQLKHAQAQANISGKTNEITAFKTSWLEKDADNNFVFRDKKRIQNLLAASSIYQDYLTAMLEARFYDYDDMILRVVHGLEVFHDLKFNLQEKYQYIMVDEFQDTNGAQMRILQSLINLPTGDEPNIMVVGDDDQAIYSFQGAEVSNILEFEKVLKKPKLIALKQNYRSTETILDVSREVITQGVERLENRVVSLNKKLQAQTKGSLKDVACTEYKTQADEFLAVSEQIAKQIKAGTPAGEIALLARNKKDILAILPYLHQQKVNVSYEHDENILESPPVVLLYNLARVINFLSRGQIDEANALLPEVLTHEAFNLKPEDIWHLSLESHRLRKNWLETMQSMPKTFGDIANWLIYLSASCMHTPLELMLDFLSGVEEVDTFKSPIKEFYFSEKILRLNPEAYIQHLESLATLRSRIREYRASDNLKLPDFVNYIQLVLKTGITLQNHYSADQTKDAVQVMTAHKAKGLEFDTVFVVNASDETWGTKSRGYSNKLSYPHNFSLSQTGDSFEDKLRLFFVAMTRARKNLYISSSQQSLGGKALLKARFLANAKWKSAANKEGLNVKLISAESTWNTHTQPTKHKTLQKLLSSYIKTYQLSATHLNSFLDVTSGGPQTFMLNGLLHFPQAISPSAAMGSSAHKALQKAHQHLRTTGEKRPVEDIVGDFEQYLAKSQLSEIDFSYQLEKGSNALRHYLENKYDTFTKDQVVEFDFKNQGVVLNDAKLTGVIDVIAIDTEHKSIEILDYKTGNPATSWQGKTDFEKIKLHKYKQQLMFYQLLIENSRDFSDLKVKGLTLEFIEPTPKHQVSSLAANFTEEEYKNFKNLVTKVWQHIISANFIDTSKYEKSHKGILKFEKDLLQ